MTAVLVGALLMAGCGQNPAPSPAGNAPPSAEAPASMSSALPTTAVVPPTPAGSSLATPPLVSGPAAEHYFADIAHPVIVSVGGDPTTWVIPTAIVLPDGEAAQRFALLPERCPPAGRITLLIDAPVEPDSWETSLDKDKMDAGVWPSPAAAACDGGVMPGSFLSLGYYPATTGEPIQIAAQADQPGTELPASVSVVPVYTSVDAERPAFTETSRIVTAAAPGPEEVRSAKPRLLAAYVFAVTTLPDGTTATNWRPWLTGCGYAGEQPGRIVSVSVQVGGAPAVDVGQCDGGGGITSDDLQLGLPADGTRISIFTTGGTTKFRFRVSEFQWRELAGP